MFVVEASYSAVRKGNAISTDGLEPTLKASTPLIIELNRLLDGSLYAIVYLYLDLFDFDGYAQDHKLKPYSYSAAISSHEGD